MRGLRHIITACFAILFAFPLCCCATHAAPASEVAAHSCCSQPAGGGQAPAHAPDCACKLKNPRIADGGKALVFTVYLSEIAPLPVFPANPSNFESDHAPVFATVFPYPLPPRLQLLMRQSFLI